MATTTTAKSTIVTTAEGKVVQFSGFLGKLIVAHPRVSVVLALIGGLILGHVL